MVRMLVAILVLAVAGLSSVATAGTSSTLAGRMPGNGRCLLTSPETFLCTFDGTFTGRLDGVQRTGKWRLTFSVKERTADYEVWNQPVAGFRLVLPAAAGNPRVVVAATGTPGGTIVAREDGGFDFTKSLTSTGDQPELTIRGRFGPATGAADRRSLLPARFGLTTVPGAGVLVSASATAGVPAVGVATGHGATVFTGTGTGRGECAVMSTELTRCAWRGTFVGKLLGVDRAGRFALQVSLHRTKAGGAEPPPYNPKEITIDKTVPWQFARTDSLPGRLLVFGPGGTGTVSFTSAEGRSMSFELFIGQPSGQLSLHLGFTATWGVDGLKATGNEVAIETIEIAHEGPGGRP